MASVTFSEASRVYPGMKHPAVDRLNLEINDGEFLVLVGPSGCGKSTTLRMLAGLEPIDDGSVFIGDRDVTWVPPRDRDIAMVFQSYALYPHMTVAENIGFHLKIKGLPKDEIRARVKEAAELLDLQDYLDRKPAKLSGGQRQRVAMGRAIVRNPKVFLMDEPLSNLDATLRLSMRGLIKRLHQDLKSTFVYVTHDQAEAMTLADRIAVMRGGLIQQLDTPEGIYERPANLFVAGFLGSPPINLIEGVMASGSFSRGGWRLALPNPPADGRSVTLGLRPEDVMAPAPGLARLDARVELVSPLGSETHLDVVAEGGLKLTLRVPKEWRAAVGDQICFGIDPARLHLFDRASELRL